MAKATTGKTRSTKKKTTVSRTAKTDENEIEEADPEVAEQEEQTLPPSADYGADRGSSPIDPETHA